MAFLVIALVMQLNVSAQIDPATNFKDWIESQTGEKYEPIPVNQNSRVPTTCAGEVIYVQENVAGPDNAYTVGSAATPSAAYDDFVIPMNTSWTISQVAFYLTYTNGVFDPTKDFTVQILADNGGMPDINNIICSSNVLGSTISSTVVGTLLGVDLNEAIMDLNTPCTLTSGTYWLCLGSNSGQNVHWEVIFNDAMNPLIGTESYLHFPNINFLTTASAFFGDIVLNDHAFALCASVPCEPVKPTIVPNTTVIRN